MKLVLRSAVAMLTGILSSGILHFAALEYIWHFHAHGSRFAAVLCAPGTLLAGSRFEAQSVVLPLNVFAYAVFFSIVSFVLLRRRVRQKL